LLVPIQQKLLYISLILLTGIAVAQFAAMTYVLYFMLWWFDIVMHFFGGAWVAVSALSILYYIRNGAVEMRTRLVVAFCSVIIVGVGWEFFEYWAKVMDVPRTVYAADTALDIVMDVFGAAVTMIVISYVAAPIQHVDTK
jgi:hypothetical protein